MKKEIRIGISGVSLHGIGKKGGFWEYFKVLLKILSENVKNEKIFIFIPDDIENEFKEIKNRNFQFVKVKIPKKGTQYFEFFILPFYLKKYKINLLHFPNFASPLILKIPYIVTVHDIAFLKFKENLKKRDYFYWKNIFGLSLKKAKLLIAVSENTKKDLHYYYKIPLKKIEVIPSFSSLIFEDFKTDLDFEKFKFNFPYFLFVGTLEPRKNIERIIEGFLRASSKIKEDLKLIVIGQKGWKFKRIVGLIEKNKDKIIWFKNIDTNELPYFYKNAIALLFPSLYEGFGLPILEAYKFKIPVITSNVSSLPYVAGKGAIILNPYNIEEIEKAIIEIYYNKNLRENLIKKQEEELKKFEYEKIGKKFLSIYRNLIKN